MVYMRLKSYRKIGRLEEFYKQYAIGLFDYVDRVSNGRGYSLVMDLTGASLMNADIGIIV